MITELLLICGAAYAVRKYYRKHIAEKVKISSEKPRKNVKKKSMTSRTVSEVSPPIRKSKDHLAIIEKKEADTDMAVSSISLGLSIAGNLFFAPLSLLSIPGWFYVSVPVFEKAFRSIRQRQVDVSIPYVVTNIACSLFQHYGTGNLAAFFYVLSKKLLSELESDSKKSLVDVFGQYPKVVWLVVEETEVEIPFEELRKNDIIAVHAGGIIPADGLIIQGAAGVDQHILTGESQPVEKDIGSRVFATTVVLSGKILIKVENAGETTIAAQIARILNQTTHFKTDSQVRADEVTHKTIIPTLVAGGLALPILGPIGSTAIMNCHFGYRMSLVSSVVMLSYLKAISQSGILIKDAKCLDLLSKVDTVVFDKTGTLTLSDPYVGHIYKTDDWQEEDILAYAAAAEYRQNHPVALAILKEALSRNADVPSVENTEYEIGYGLKVRSGTQIIHIGSQRFMVKESCHIPDMFENIEKSVYEQGHSLIMVALNDAVIGAIELRPTLRPGTREAIRFLREECDIKNLYIISGDNEEPTKKLAQDLGITDYFSNVLPQQKAELISELQNSGKTVCYLGDGINDAIALKKAQVSVSLRGASAVATDTSQIILMNENLGQLVSLFRFSKKFHTTMKQSLNCLLGHSFVGAMGAFFLDFSIVDTLLLKQLGLTLSVGNSVKPLVVHRQIRKTEP